MERERKNISLSMSLSNCLFKVDYIITYIFLVIFNSPVVLVECLLTSSRG